jgi:hypothetical protein
MLCGGLRKKVEDEEAEEVEEDEEEEEGEKVEAEEEEVEAEAEEVEEEGWCARLAAANSTVAMALGQTDTKCPPGISAKTHGTSLFRAAIALRTTRLTDARYRMSEKNVPCAHDARGAISNTTAH